MKNKILLISGCSHAAGSEIDGTLDSAYNRSKSFGNLLAEKLGYKPINAAIGASNNQCIARTVLEWFKTNYNSDEMEVKVLIAWTEPTRVDIPIRTDYIQYDEERHPSADYYSMTARNYLKVNIAWKGLNDWEKQIVETAHAFMADNPLYFEIVSANIVLQLQYYLKSNSIDYLMCNSTHLFSDLPQLRFYVDLIDRTRYYHPDRNELAFFTKYKHLGFINEKAVWYHHGEEPHRLYAEELYNFLTNR